MDLTKIAIEIINLHHRTDRKNHMVKQLKRWKIKNANFNTVWLDSQNPVRGCIKSHIDIIKRHFLEGTKYLMILEDDAVFKLSPNTIPLPPNDWDMLYLGGTLRTIKKHFDNWTRCTTWNAHAYIVNMQNKKLIKQILGAEKQMKAFDYYLEEIVHPFFNVYMATPMRILQLPGYSDIENREVDYKYMESSLNGLREPEHDIVDGAYILKLGDAPKELPFVSIITPTYNRRNMFSIAIRNYEKFDYPRDKMEWIIIDDGEESIRDILPEDSTIRYLQISEKLTIGKKRNIANERANGYIRIHMDDDDYYPPESIISRVKILLKYPTIHCVGCNQLGVYDLINDTSSISCDSTLAVAEASMAYTKYFWFDRRFPEDVTTGEYIKFIQDRFTSIMVIPYVFVMFAFSHQTNITDQARRIKNTELQINGKILNFPEMWDIETREFVKLLRKYLFDTQTCTNLT